MVLLVLWPQRSSAEGKRMVLLKVDGLPADLVDRFVAQRDGRTGKSSLPWIEHVFYRGGTRLANFYVRGTSLSAPSWSMLETGQHLQIKGNVEFDRYTLRSYDYLNFFPFYVSYSRGTRVDMPGVEVLDSLGIPMLLDEFPYEDRYPGLQLFQRGVRWTALGDSMKHYFRKSPKKLVDEWTMGLELRAMVYDQVERDITQSLKNPSVRYLDYMFTDFDHAGHNSQYIQSFLYSLQRLDALVGRLWTAIQQSPGAADTVLILVSDHGFNANEHIFSQGVNLVKLLGSAEGGGHHVITKRRLLMDYSIKGIYPMTPLISTPAAQSYYLKKDSSEYPTAVLDFDGNERAALHLRDSDLNVLHILLQQLQGKTLPPDMRRAMTGLFFQTIDRRRQGWSDNLATLREEMGALARSIESLRTRVAAQQKKWSQLELDTGKDKEARRLAARLDAELAEHRDYAEYARAIENLLALAPDGFVPAKLRIEDVIPRRAMGDHNNVHQLQNYVVGFAPEGPMLAGDGTLDVQASFHRVNYYSVLQQLSVRNNVQPGVSNRPVDLVVTRIDASDISGALPPELRSGEDAVWLNGGPDRQALILSRQTESGVLQLRYLPVRYLVQAEDGRVQFQKAEWGPDFPLRIWEDQKLDVASEARAGFLNDWHSDAEWLRALHKTAYSNGLIGLQEHFARHPIDGLAPRQPLTSSDERLLRRFQSRKRRMVETDLLVLANDHWNFDVRGFNPGGNHGSLFRISTHATLMLAGGANTGVPQGRVIEEPYDGLSFVPTVFALMDLPASPNRTPDNGSDGIVTDRIRPIESAGCATRFPGRLIEELVPNRRGNPCAPALQRGD